MHTVWKGAISFGLVHVPVKMFTATEDKDISLRMIHKPCGSPIAYVRRCPNCDVEAEWDDIIKGYEYEKGSYVLFEKDELEQLAGEKSHTIQFLILSHSRKLIRCTSRKRIICPRIKPEAMLTAYCFKQCPIPARLA